MRKLVKIFYPSGEVNQGFIAFSKEGMNLVDNEGNDLAQNQVDLSYEIIDRVFDDKQIVIPKERIEYCSSSFIRKYLEDASLQEDLYPPSSKKWITHISQNGSDALVTLQKIKGIDKYLMSIVDISSNNLLRLHPVNGFELNALTSETDWEYFNSVFDKPLSEQFSINDLLDAPAPSGSDLVKLIEGVDTRQLNIFDIKGTVKDTLDPLVPKSFPEDIRKQLMVFLAWTTRVKVPKDDPLGFLTIMYKRFQSNSLLLSLVLGHIQCLVQGIPTPQYIRIMAMVDQGVQVLSLRPTIEEVEVDPWSITWIRIMEKFPDRKNRMIEMAHSMNLTQEVHTAIPISQDEAKKSTEAWLDRFAMMRSGFLLRSHIQDQRIGLSKLVYIGGAHRWPHKHLCWTARLGNPGTKPPYIQVLVMPRISAERLTRTSENFTLVDWSATRWNFGLYDSKRDKWKNTQLHLFNSLSHQKTIKQLGKEFEVDVQGKLNVISKTDARVLDALSWGVYLHTLELGKYDDILGINRDELAERIANYKASGILQIHYFPIPYGLASICLVSKGERKQLNSLARATLIHLPSATVMISEQNKTCIVMARVPEESAYDLLINLPDRANDFGIMMKGYRATAYSGYIHNLYQRLRLPDGTWDEDISGLLSQIRS